MFNFFNEIKSKFKDLKGKIVPFECILMGNYLLYIEGFEHLMTYNEQVVVVKVKGGVITVNGTNLTIKEITPKTISIGGKIISVENV